MARKKKKSVRPRSSAASKSLAAEAYKQSVKELFFEEEPSKPGGDFQDFLVLLYGPPKIGKSELARRIDGIYFLPTEPGFKFFSSRKTKIPNWATFIAFIKKMEKHPKMVAQVKMWCIDTADNLSKFCMQYACGRANIAHPTDEEWGKGWEAFRDEFSHWFLRLAALGPGIIAISHEKQREVISRSIKITKDSPAMPTTTFVILNNLCDVILHMSFAKKKGKRDPVRALFTKPTETRDAGDRTGMLPAVIFFKDEQDAINQILEAYEPEKAKKKGKVKKKRRKKKKSKK
ncbi:MAG: AAA family ATPase [Planctomycetes bacterium]|nr:AAA family ATPase [Planctomycetota bacterium]